VGAAGATHVADDGGQMVKAMGAEYEHKSRSDRNPSRAEPSRSEATEKDARAKMPGVTQLGTRRRVASQV
jgi:hypothetical protein